MPDFEFLQNKLTGKWVILAPRRAERPDEAKGGQIDCPFCSGREKEDSNWKIRVVPNKYAFAPIHEIIIHSPSHHKNFGELSSPETELIFNTYRDRFRAHTRAGLPAGRQVYIFHNRGEKAGESLPHPHSQVAVVPQNIKLEIPPLETGDFENPADRIETSNFYLFCPRTSDWPDEVWLAPRSLGEVGVAHTFGDATDEEISDLANIITKLVQIFSIKYGKEFPYNFYISPGDNWPASNASQSDAGWYLRFIPRVKTLGGFEIGTNVFVNTQSPKETLEFLRKNFK